MQGRACRKPLEVAKCVSHSPSSFNDAPVTGTWPGHAQYAQIRAALPAPRTTFESAACQSADQVATFLEKTQKKEKAKKPMSAKIKLARYMEV